MTYQYSDKLSVIIPAGGQGLRMGEKTPKQFLELNGKPIIQHTLAIFEALDWIGSIMLCVPLAEVDNFKVITRNSAKIKVVAGGEKRQDSVYNGLTALATRTGFVAVHDGVRPFVSEGLISDVFQAAKEFGAAVAAIPVNDTLKRGNKRGFLEAAVERENLWRMQTPQIFKVEILWEALEMAQKESFSGTDEGSLVQLIGKPVKFVPGSEFNIKITRPEDLVIGEWIASSNRFNSKSYL